MKYIRTKDSLSKIETMLNCKELYDYLMQFDNYKDNLLEVADTIEELCDEFVIANWKEKGKPILCKYQKDKNALYYIDENGFNALFIPDLLKSNCEIYCAIWTDKGLIYVAKMNDKGEFELL